MKTQLYFIPGLGSDARMYAPYLEAFPNAKVLEFIRPFYGETIEEFALRMAAGIDTSSPFSLVGTSLGGILAVEISRVLQPQKIVLIASVKCRNELPLLLKSLKSLKVHKLLRAEVVTRAKARKFNRLIPDSKSEFKQSLLDMNEQTDKLFIEWAADAVFNWKGVGNYRKDIVHFHGTKDELFPFRRIKDCVALEGGTHLIATTDEEKLIEQLKYILES